MFKIKKKNKSLNTEPVKTGSSEMEIVIRRLDAIEKDLEELSPSPQSLNINKKD